MENTLLSDSSQENPNEDEFEKVEENYIKLKSKKIHNGKLIYSLIETEDKRIATGSSDGSICISSIIIETNSFNKDIYHKHAHSQCIDSFCILRENRLISGSRDSLLKIWKLLPTKLEQLHIINKHSNWIWKIILLPNNRFASCSWDTTINIWEDNNEYKLLSTLHHKGPLVSMLHLQGKDMLISFGYQVQTGITFWNSKEYVKYRSIVGYGIQQPLNVIEVNDNHIIVCAKTKPHYLVVIDCVSFIVVKEISVVGIRCNSALYRFNQNSFIYVYRGVLLQISSENYNVLFKKFGGKFNGFYAGIIPFDNGKYLVVENEGCLCVLDTEYLDLQNFDSLSS